MMDIASSCFNVQMLWRTDTISSKKLPCTLCIYVPMDADSL